MRLIVWMIAVHYLELPLLTSGIDPRVIWAVAIWAAALDLAYLWMRWSDQAVPDEMFTVMKAIDETGEKG